MRLNGMDRESVNKVQKLKNKVLFHVARLAFAGRLEEEKDICRECGKCKEACPYNAITDLIRPCVKSCPVDAIFVDTSKKAVIDVRMAQEKPLYSKLSLILVLPLLSY
jgi:ferredoxin